MFTMMLPMMVRNTLAKAKGAANATINRELSALHRMYSLGAIATPPKVLHMPHISKLEERNVRKGYFEYEQYTQLRAALPDYLKGVLTLAYFSGMRKGEILSLTWDQVSFFESKINLDPGTTKNDDPRTFHFGNRGEVYDVIFRQKVSHDNE